MQRVLASTATLVVALATQATPACAQAYGSGGYGPVIGGLVWYGGPGSTVEGDLARGLGQFALGAGFYNELTARAEAIHADTLWRRNQYAYLSQQEANRAYARRSWARRDRIVRSKEETYQRLHDHPTPRDIARGDALNVALDELRDPRVSLHALKRCRTRLHSLQVRDIPLHYAPAAVTFSVNQLLQDGPPPVLRNGAFVTERTALATFTAEVRKELGEREELRPEAIARGLELIWATWARVEAVLPAGTVARREAEAYLKGWSVLCPLLGTPAADVLLAGTGGRPETRLGELVSVMSLHDLRFGVARMPRQREVYGELYPLLASFRDEARAAITVALNTEGRGRPGTGRSLPLRVGRQSVRR
jgi:hypothetical protein